MLPLLAFCFAEHCFFFAILCLHSSYRESRVCGDHPSAVSLVFVLCSYCFESLLFLSSFCSLFSAGFVHWHMFATVFLSVISLYGVWSAPGGLSCEGSSFGPVPRGSPREKLCQRRREKKKQILYSSSTSSSFFSYRPMKASVHWEGGSPVTEVSERPPFFLSCV